MKEENGPFIALIVFVVLSIGFTVMAVLSYQDLGLDDPNPDKNRKNEIVKLNDDIRKLEGKIEGFQSTARDYQGKIREQQRLQQYYTELEAEFVAEGKRRAALVKWFEDFQAQAGDLSGIVASKKEATRARLEKETNDVRADMEKDLAQKATEKEASVARGLAAKADYDKAVATHRIQKNVEESTLDDKKSVLSDLTQREVERSNVLMEADGKVILADPVHNFAVIDLGTAAGVRNGFRFECYAIRPGNKKAHKAYLEVTRADVSRSECLVVDRPIALTKDPLSDYYGEPEAKYSPYQESGKKGFGAQPLDGRAKTVMMGVSKDDPIVEGDLIQNPLFSPKKKYTFYIAGAKELVNERQKSSIVYRWTEIKAAAEAYGGKVSSTVDTNVDMVIAQKNPAEGSDSEKAEFKQAVNLGIPVLYEWELFRFLDNR